MSENVSAVLGLIAVLAALWWLAALVARRLQGLILLLTGSVTASSASYDIVVLPGVVLHELAHILVAVALGVRIIRVDLFRFRRSGDPRQGEVIVERVDPFRMSLVGAGPLLAGVPVVLLLLHWLHIPPLGMTVAVLQEMRSLLGQPLNLLRLYLLWAIANAMFPSAADRAAWWVVGACAIVVGGIVALTGYWPALPLSISGALRADAARLTSGLLPVVALDFVLLVVVGGLGWLAGRVTGRRVIRSR